MPSNRNQQYAESMGADGKVERERKREREERYQDSKSRLQQCVKNVATQLSRAQVNHIRSQSILRVVLAIPCSAIRFVVIQYTLDLEVAFS